MYLMHGTVDSIGQKAAIKLPSLRRLLPAAALETMGTKKAGSLGPAF